MAFEDDICVRCPLQLEQLCPSPSSLSHSQKILSRISTELKEQLLRSQCHFFHRPSSTLFASRCDSSTCGVLKDLLKKVKKSDPKYGFHEFIEVQLFHNMGAPQPLPLSIENVVPENKTENHSSKKISEDDERREAGVRGRVVVNNSTEGEDNTQKIACHLNALIFVHSSTDLAKVASLLQEEMTKQLKEMIKVIGEAMSSLVEVHGPWDGKSSLFHLPANVNVYHYLITQCEDEKMKKRKECLSGEPQSGEIDQGGNEKGEEAEGGNNSMSSNCKDRLVTLIIPDGDLFERFRLSVKGKLHQRYNLPTNMPVFHPQLSLFSEEMIQVDRLVNIHESMSKPSGLKDGKEYLVKGKYLYYHYLQDRMDDQGWGCAYRSMQTICSWIQLQYLALKDPSSKLTGAGKLKSVPNHEDIQKTLVNLGDKPYKFINSREWIGAMEIAMCLQDLYGISCKVIHVNSGAEIAGKARELATHFETQGSPIMIGGGVLAYTLLGIDWNEATGGVKFLILDPHYVGDDNEAKIINKGWCGWKDASLFLSDRFYNLCLPQKPENCI